MASHLLLQPTDDTESDFAQVSYSDYLNGLAKALEVNSDETKMNTNHDARGRFGSGGSGSSATGPSDWTKDARDVSEAEGKALEQYSLFSMQLNADLRDGSTLSAKHQQHIEALDSAISSSKSSQQTLLYRSMPSAAVANLEVGSTITDKAYMSTSKQHDVARGLLGITGTPDTLLQINAPKGTRGIDMNRALGNRSEYADQHEVLLPRGTQLRVTLIRDIGRFKTVYAEIVTDSTGKAFDIPEIEENDMDDETKMNRNHDARGRFGSGGATGTGGGGGITTGADGVAQGGGTTGYVGDINLPSREGGTSAMASEARKFSRELKAGGSHGQTISNAEAAEIGGEFTIAARAHTSLAQEHGIMASLAGNKTGGLKEQINHMRAQKANTDAATHMEALAASKVGVTAATGSAYRASLSTDMSRGGGVNGAKINLISQAASAQHNLGNFASAAKLHTEAAAAHNKQAPRDNYLYSKHTDAANAHSKAAAANEQLAMDAAKAFDIPEVEDNAMDDETKMNRNHDARGRFGSGSSGSGGGDSEDGDGGGSTELVSADEKFNTGAQRARDGDYGVGDVVSTPSDGKGVAVGFDRDGSFAVVRTLKDDSYRSYHNSDLGLAETKMNRNHDARGRFGSGTSGSGGGDGAGRVDPSGGGNIGDASPEEVAASNARYGPNTGGTASQNGESIRANATAVSDASRDANGSSADMGFMPMGKIAIIKGQIEQGEFPRAIAHHKTQANAHEFAAKQAKNESDASDNTSAATAHRQVVSSLTAMQSTATATAASENASAASAKVASLGGSAAPPYVQGQAAVAHAAAGIANDTARQSHFAAQSGKVGDKVNDSHSVVKRMHSDVRDGHEAAARGFAEAAGGKSFDTPEDEGLQIYTGFEVKALGNGKVGGYLVRYSQANSPDLVGDYFTDKSDLGTQTSLPVLYHHGQDKTIGKRVIGTGTLRKDDVGVWVETQLALRDDYEKHIYKLAEQGKLGWSSGSVSHLVERETKGKGVSWVKSWWVAEASLTPTPAEPQNHAFTKGHQPPNLEDDLLEESDDGVEPTADIVTKTEDTEMSEQTIDELKAAIAGLTKRLDEPKVEAGKMAAFVKTVGGDHDGGYAFKHWIRTGVMNSYTKNNEQDWTATKTNVLNETTGTEGGILVPEGLYTTIIAKRDEMSIIRANGAMVIQTNLDSVQVPVENARMTTAIVAESGSYVAAEPTFTSNVVPIYKFGNQLRLTDELVSDEQTNIMGYLSNGLGRAFGLMENQYCIAGTGSAQPKGLLTGGTAAITAASTTAITAAELVSLYHALPEPYTSNPSEVIFVTRNATLGALRALASSSIFTFNLQPQGDQGAQQLYGHKVAVSGYMQAATTGQKSILVTNLAAGYIMCERAGMVMQRNPYLLQATGQIALFSTMRFGGTTTVAEATQILTQA